MADYKSTKPCPVCGREFESYICQHVECCSYRCAAIKRNRNRRKPAAERFWLKVRKTLECWWWTGSKLRGYGRFSPDGVRPVVAHRYSWELAHGPIPDGLNVCHHCDNPSCVRTDHLFLGTQQANMRDSRAKRRLSAKLAPAFIPDIKRKWEQGRTHQDIADEYGVTRTAITQILTGKRWSGA